MEMTPRLLRVGFALGILAMLASCRGTGGSFPPPENSAGAMKAAGFDMPRDLLGRYTIAKKSKGAEHLLIRSLTEARVQEGGKWRTYRVCFSRQEGGWWRMGWMDIERPPLRVELYRIKGRTFLDFLTDPAVTSWPWGNYLYGPYLKLPD